MKKLTPTKKFILKAQKVHGVLYDYSKVRYKDSRIHVRIICKRHGVFSQTPQNHLAGAGCKYCAYNRLTKDEFLAKANKIHNNFYDYSKSKYSHKLKTSEIIVITCLLHGDFEQRIDLHLRGHGCPFCLKKRRKVKKLNHEKQKNIIQPIEEYSINVRYELTNSVQVQVKSIPFKNKIIVEKHLQDFEVFLDMVNCKILDKNIKIISKTNQESEVIKSSDAFLKKIFNNQISPLIMRLFS